MRILHPVLPLALLLTFLGCTGNKSNPPPAYAIDIQPGDAKHGYSPAVRVFFGALADLLTGAGGKQ